jgi:hypothetical protein
MSVQQRHVGVRSDRRPAALPLPLRRSDGGARRESHRDMLPISRACQWFALTRADVSAWVRGGREAT